ncbi:MAG: hypothetical protein ABH874_02300 [Methanobacteriota archaeon]|jgi:predicted Zn-ribbon and HTH transcriptional regulator|nr:hypothetical protein [Candidatus Hydrothermarchaeota archaeon]
MVEKIMVCEECGKMFRIKYDLLSEAKCPSCDGNKIMSIYRQYNIRERL